MIRKFAIAFAAIAALGIAFTATPADAKGGKGGKGGGFHHHHFHGGPGLGVATGVGLLAYDSCYRRVWVVNRFGETVLRRIYVCG